MQPAERLGLQADDGIGSCVDRHSLVSSRLTFSLKGMAGWRLVPPRRTREEDDEKVRLRYFRKHNLCHIIYNL
jgi:hypothetical protein